MSPAMALPEYLTPLNPEQKEAVIHSGSPLLILAGAGSGKTRVITTKIAYLIRECGVSPHSILAVTFTNKAAREMAERARNIDERAKDVMLRTFHSFGAWFLRRHSTLAGLDSNFTIYDDDDSATLLSSLMPGVSRSEAARTAHLVARAKDYFLNPEDADLDRIDHRPEFRRWYTLYEQRLGEIGNVDFGDLIKKPVELLRSHPEVAQRFKQRFKVILVDEYQDSNLAQFELLKELHGLETYLCVVGDDDQSIYRFRGAEVKNILEFPEHFPGTQIIRLERNYRSTAPILRIADAVVDHNQGRLGKILRSVRGEGKQATVAFLPDQDAETIFCAELIEKAVVKGSAYSDWAILYRTNAQSVGFETTFLHRHIPYRVVGSLKFYEREEVKDALALLAFSLNPRDEVAFRRVVNKPTRGIGNVSVDRIIEASIRTSGNLAEAAAHASLSKKAVAGVQAFIQAVNEGGRSLDSPEKKEKKDAGSSKGIKMLRAGEGLSLYVERILTASGIVEYHAAQDEIAGTQRLANLQELVNAASIYSASMEGVALFLEHIELDRAMESDDGGSDAVTLITLHNTKGLEFSRVIITGLEQGIFPRDDKKDEDLEEERRLFYVGATRAKNELYLSSCAQRRIYGHTNLMQPSLFLQEIPEAELRILGQRYMRPNHGYSGFHGGANTATKKRTQVSSDGLWKLGSNLYHDDFGYGRVVEIREAEEGPVIYVHFESGKKLQFLSRYQSSSFMRMGSDE